MAVLVHLAAVLKERRVGDWQADLLPPPPCKDESEENPEEHLASALAGHPLGEEEQQEGHRHGVDAADRD